MARLRLITEVVQGPVGVLRVAIGDRFYTADNREYHFGKLANAYYAWTEPGGELVVEVWDQGQKFGEYVGGMFLLGPRYSTPRGCATGCQLAAAPQTTQAIAPPPSPAAPTTAGRSEAPAATPLSTTTRNGVAEIGPGTPGYKDPSTATILGFILTGAGHIYAGEGGTGAFLLLGSVAAVGIGAGVSTAKCDRFSCSTDYTPLYVGIGVATAFALVSLFDAAPAAHRHNRRAAKALGMSPIEPIFTSSREGTQVGLRFRLGKGRKAVLAAGPSVTR